MFQKLYNHLEEIRSNPAWIEQGRRSPRQVDAHDLFSVQTPSQPQRPPESPRGIVRLRTVVIHEYSPIAHIAEDSPAEFPDIRRSFQAAGCLHIEIPEPLQRPVLFLRQKFNAHSCSHNWLTIKK